MGLNNDLGFITLLPSLHITSINLNQNVIFIISYSPKRVLKDRRKPKSKEWNSKRKSKGICLQRDLRRWRRSPLWLSWVWKSSQLSSALCPFPPPSLSEEIQRPFPLLRAAAQKNRDGATGRREIGTIKRRLPQKKKKKKGEKGTGIFLSRGLDDACIRCARTAASSKCIVLYMQCLFPGQWRKCFCHNFKPVGHCFFLFCFSKQKLEILMRKNLVKKCFNFLYLYNYGEANDLLKLLQKITIIII